ncbi:MAG: hypothetical protein Q9221_007997 [Calogaya cf. arnoldii]
MKCVPTSVLALFINPLSLFVLCALIDTEQYRALRPRAITAVDAGIGIELECRKFSFDNLGYRAASAFAEEIKAIKGKTILPAEYHGVQSSAGEWELTAELTGPEDTWRLRRVCAEFIVSGEKNQWQPNFNDQTKATIAEFEPFGQWTVAEPEKWRGSDALLWSRQVTVAMPLKAIYQLFVDLKRDGISSNAIMAEGSKRDNIHVVRREDFRLLGLTGFKPADITDDLLGFLSLVVSYAKATRRMQAKDGPKHSLSVMPRTDFAAMYELVRKKIEPQYQGGCYDFYTVVKELARMQGDLSGNRDRNYDKDQLDGQTFKWPHPQEEPFTDTDISNYEGGGEGPPAPLPPPLPILKPPPPPKGPPPRKAPTPSHQLVKSITPYTLSDPVDKKWEDSNHDVSTGTVKVEKWLTRIQDNDQDLIAIMESKLRHGQFGRLGSKMEYILGTKRPAQIFEF